MKISKFAMTTLLCLSLTLAACNITIGDTEFGVVRGTGDVVTEEREVSGIRKVVLSNQGDLEITVGDQESLVVEAQSDLLEYIETDVRGGTLEIGTRDGVNMMNTQPIRYLLTVKELEGLTVNSSGGIKAPELQAKSFSVQISSSGPVVIEALYADKLDVGISSSGDVMIQGGEVTNLDANISSSGNLEMQDVPVQTAKVSVTSNGDARINVSDELSGNISSSGNIYVQGNPQVDVSTSSSGKVIQE